MKVAYVDSSALVAIVFGEPGATATIRQLDACDELFSSNLLEAELKANLAREQVALEAEMLRWMSWVLPDRSLVQEIDRVLAGCFDLEGIMTIARQAGIDCNTAFEPFPEKAAVVKIGVIRDRVFTFYYPENLEALTRAGAELVFIDSMQDRELPDIDGLYIGGGFP